MSLRRFYQALGLMIGCVCSNVFLSAEAAEMFSGYHGGKGQARNVILQRDPFTPSDKMYGEVGIQSAQKANGVQGFIAGFGMQSVPKMRVRGFVNKEKNKSVALLEVEGAGVFLVKEGEEIGLQALGQNTVLKVLKVDGNSVKVQSGQINQVIIVR